MTGDASDPASAPSWLEVITLFAVFFGPIAAVLVTRHIDGWRDRHSRKMHIFRTLMATRRLKLSPDHVSALNLIEIEFYDHKHVIEKWEVYVRHLSTPIDDAKRWSEIADELYTEMVQEIGRSLKYNIEQLAIFKGGYAPSWYETTEMEQAEFRRLVLRILRGERAFPIMMVHTAQDHPMFPPPPQ